MNGKRISALAIAALISMAAPAMAVTNPSGTVTVKWNTQALANMTLVTQSVAPAVAGNIATHNATPPNVYWAGNGSTASGCDNTVNTATAGTDTSANLTVNFGNVTPDSAQSTDCWEGNAIDAYVQTNDTNGYKLTVQATGGIPAGYGTTSSELCLSPAGGAAWTANQAYVSEAAVAAPAETSVAGTCPAGATFIPSAAASANLISGALGATTGANLNGDLELVVAANAPSGAQSVVVTYTMLPQ